jgi:hypothetical protein
MNYFVHYTRYSKKIFAHNVTGTGKFDDANVYEDINIKLNAFDKIFSHFIFLFHIFIHCYISMRFFNAGNEDWLLSASDIGSDVILIY